jgi:HAD superfamily hydrolase (TIGR01509 family)
MPRDLIARTDASQSSSMETRQVKAVIFDMDGLMLDTERLYRKACQQAAVDFGYAVSEEVHSRCMGRSAAGARQVMLDEFGPGFPIDEFESRCEELESALLEHGAIPKKPGVDGLLDFLDARQVRKAVATSTRRKRSVPQLAVTGLLERFDAVATGDEVTHGKPAPDLFLLAAQRLGVAPEMCLVLEDAEPGVIAAHRAGMQVFVVPDLQPVSAEARSLADGVFDSLDAVTAQLRND